MREVVDIDDADPSRVRVLTSSSNSSPRMLSPNGSIGPCSGRLQRVDGTGTGRGMKEAGPHVPNIDVGHERERDERERATGALEKPTDRGACGCDHREPRRGHPRRGVAFAAEGASRSCRASAVLGAGGRHIRGQRRAGPPSDYSRSSGTKAFAGPCRSGANHDNTRSPSSDCSSVDTDVGCRHRRPPSPILERLWIQPHRTRRPDSALRASWRIPQPRLLWKHVHRRVLRRPDDESRRYDMSTSRRHSGLLGTDAASRWPDRASDADGVLLRAR